ncbi:L-threonine-O-3-phosphate decarboxylase (plasmid) [Methylorubrum extorquens CM4]|uniref:8-amino-7-oxononanoate synthase n=3 Tax=Methylorubrum extorquens TaxID=408 RepID=B7L3N6_METC4|nr:L-threonine-O-3-phosphate decarboxylase [Methylorubrum extorquens CM4]
MARRSPDCRGSAYPFHNKPVPDRACDARRGRSGGIAAHEHGLRSVLASEALGSGVGHTFDPAVAIYLPPAPRRTLAVGKSIGAPDPGSRSSRGRLHGRAGFGLPCAAKLNHRTHSRFMKRADILRMTTVSRREGPLSEVVPAAFLRSHAGEGENPDLPDTGSEPASRSDEEGLGKPGFVYHGGGLAAARARFRSAPSPWLDLSTGINPHPYPVGEIEPSAWSRLPEPQDLLGLQAIAAKAYGAPVPEMVVAAPGTQALIQLLPRLIPARNVAVLGFGYQEHPRAWRAAGADVRIVETEAELVAAGVDVAVVINPNNPDGRRISSDRLSSIAARLGRRGSWLIVDEAFIDVMGPEASLVPALPQRGTVVLRSFGKTYGLAGLRLGFAISDPQSASLLRAALGPWAISGPAIVIGSAALSDGPWLAGMTDRLARDSIRLDRLLEAASFRIEGGTPLFRLARHSSAAEWFDRLGASGILARPFPARREWLRFGIPADEPAWTRLSAGLGLEALSFGCEAAEG